MKLLLCIFTMAWRRQRKYLLLILLVLWQIFKFQLWRILRLMMFLLSNPNFSSFNLFLVELMINFLKLYLWLQLQIVFVIVVVIVTVSILIIVLFRIKLDLLIEPES